MRAAMGAMITTSTIVAGPDAVNAVATGAMVPMPRMLLAAARRLRADGT